MPNDVPHRFVIRASIDIRHSTFVISSAGQLRAGVDQTLGDQGHHQVPRPAPLGSEEAFEPELAEGPQDRLDVAMRLGPFDDQQLADRHELLASQHPPQRLDLVGRQWVRLARVRFRTFLPSRCASRSRIAGGEFRLRILSTYMGTTRADITGKSSKN